MKAVLHTQGWIEDHGKGEGGEATASIHVILEVDGRIIPNVSRVAVVASGTEFTRLVATMYPGELETRVHDKESWEALTQDHDDPVGAPRRKQFREGLRLLSRRSST